MSSSDRCRLLSELPRLAQLRDARLMAGTLFGDALFNVCLHFARGRRRLFLQGVDLRLAFAFDRVDSLVQKRTPLLWGAIAAAVSLLPIGGTALVWLPGSIILASSGHWAKGIILLAWGAGVVGMLATIV